MYNIAMIVGSLRKESYNRKTALEVAKLAPQSLKCSLIEIGSLPFYNEDLDTDAPPAEWVRFREEVMKADGVMFFTPEYNRTIPGALKNAVDVGSRPYGKSVWNGKPACVVSVSTGAISGFGANHNLRQALVFLNMPCMQQPESYIGNVASLMENGKFKENTATFLKTIVEAYANWVKLILQ